MQWCVCVCSGGSSGCLRSVVEVTVSARLVVVHLDDSDHHRRSVGVQYHHHTNEDMYGSKGRDLLGLTIVVVVVVLVLVLVLRSSTSTALLLASANRKKSTTSYSSRKSFRS